MIYAIDMWWAWFLFAGAAIGFISYAVHDDSSWGALWVAVICLCLFIVFSPLAVATGHWAWEHRNQIPLFIGAYILVGTGWGVLKWQFHVLRCARDYARHVGEFKDAFQSWDKSVHKRAPYPQWLAAYHDLPPSPGKNRSRIVTWMVWWPFSFLDTLLSDLIRRLFDWVYDELSEMLEYISSRAFRHFDELKDADPK